MMFAMGILAYRFQWLDRMSNGTGFMALLIGVGLVIGNYLRDGGPWDAFVWQWFGIYESLMCVFISFGLIWLFRELVCGTSKVWLWCAAQSYGAYVFHLILMFILQNAVDGIWMGAFGKFLFIGIATTILSFLMTWMVKMIPGLKKVL
jgi:peptidoglycan/LPS O-acetylase OafA/YrhL